MLMGRLQVGNHWLSCWGGGRASQGVASWSNSSSGTPPPPPATPRRYHHRLSRHIPPLPVAGGENHAAIGTGPGTSSHPLPHLWHHIAAVRAPAGVNHQQSVLLAGTVAQLKVQLLRLGQRQVHHVAGAGCVHARGQSKTTRRR